MLFRSVIAGASLGITVLKEVLAAIGSVNRKIAIGIDNESGFNWKTPSHYFFSGTSDQTMPYHLKSGKTKFSICRAVVV